MSNILRLIGIDDRRFELAGRAWVIPSLPFTQQQRIKNRVLLAQQKKDAAMEAAKDKFLALFSIPKKLKEALGKAAPELVVGLLGDATPSEDQLEAYVIALEAPMIEYGEALLKELQPYQIEGDPISAQELATEYPPQVMGGFTDALLGLERLNPNWERATDSPTTN